MVSNLLSLIERFGFVPNGCRTYYLNRSQPPLLSEMVRIVSAALQSTDPRRSELLARALPALLTEHAYWTRGPKRVVFEGIDIALPGSGSLSVSLARYWAAWDGPRPESYSEDFGLVSGWAAGDASDDAERRRRQAWRDVATAAESGWDFSSRWLGDGVSLATIRTTTIAPSDLNGFLVQMERNISGELRSMRTCSHDIHFFLPYA